MPNKTRNLYKTFSKSDFKNLNFKNENGKTALHIGIALE